MAESGPSYTIHTHTAHVHSAGFPLPSLASLLGYFRQSRLALAQPDLLCWGRGRRSKGQSAPACVARCARALGHRCIGVRSSGGLELRTNVGGLSVCDTITPVYEQCLDSKCAKFCWCQMSACEYVRLSLCEALSGGQPDLVQTEGWVERVGTEMRAQLAPGSEDSGAPSPFQRTPPPFPESIPHAVTTRALLPTGTSRPPGLLPFFPRGSWTGFPARVRGCVVASAFTRWWLLCVPYPQGGHGRRGCPGDSGPGAWAGGQVPGALHVLRGRGWILIASLPLL